MASARTPPMLGQPRECPTLQAAALSAHSFSGTGSFAGSSRSNSDSPRSFRLAPNEDEAAVDLAAHETRNMVLLGVVFTTYFGYRSGCLIVLPLASKFLLSDALDNADYSPLYQLPLAAWFLMDILIAIPNALLMERYGRGTGFLLGFACAALASFVAFLALTFITDKTAAYVVMIVLIMPLSSIGMAEFVKYAAAEACADDSRRAQTVSRVITSGAVLSAFGPGSSSLAAALDPGNRQQGYAYFFLIMGCFALLSAVASAFLKLPPLAQKGQEPVPPLRTILRRPDVYTAIFAQVSVQFTMVMPMSATPLAMVDDVGLQPGSVVISGCVIAHVLSMFLPGLFTGSCIGKVGTFPIMGTGILLQALCMVVTLFGYHVWNFYAGLILLGMGWNFAFVASTMLLLASHSPQERTKVTSFNEMFRFVANGIASILSSTLHWKMVCAVSLVFLALVMASSGVQLRQRQRA